MNTTPETPTRLIWTKYGLAKWAQGKVDPAHTISAPNIADVYQGFVSQFKPGTPWMLLDGDDHLLDRGTAGA